LDKPYEIPRSRLLPTLVVFVFVLGILYTLFLFFSRFNANGDIETLEAEKLDVELAVVNFDFADCGIA